MIKVKSLHIYPIKALAGIQLDEVEITSRGLKHDRRWVLIDKQNKFISQREYPQLALLHPQIGANEMTIIDKSGKMSKLRFSLAEPNSIEEEVTVWDDRMPVKEVSQETNLWFSQFMEMDVRLMYMHEDSIRQADQRYAIKASDKVSFADGYPVLIVSEASMEFLNAKLEETLSIDRFRGNIIVSGSTPHEEDTWREIKIGQQQLFGVKPCARCQVTTIDPETATYGKEPLKTLSNYRRLDHKILFGENFIPGNESTIRIGDEIEVFERKTAPII